jgi:putative ABC transport system substrate-binding protein
VRRREFITLLGGTAAWPLAARAQQTAMTRVVIVTIQPRTASMYAAFDRRLREVGYVEGQNLAVHYVNPEHQVGALPAQSRRRVIILPGIRGQSLSSATAYSPKSSQTKQRKRLL